MPELHPCLQELFRTAYGLLLIGTLIQALPHARRFFFSERWGGYGESRFSVDLIQNPIVVPVVISCWFITAWLLVIGWLTVVAASLNLLFCRYFFVQMRWSGTLRGMGAPGFMAYWIGGAVFLLEYTFWYAPELRAFALLVLQVDFALIMLSAGIYKYSAGYSLNNGMELGLVNPAWGYWWRKYAQVRPNHWVFRFMNQTAWMTEIAMAVLMILPPTRLWGGLLMAMSFVFVWSQIRLGFLCEMLVIVGLLYVAPISFAVPVVTSPAPETSFASLSVFNSLVEIGLWCYIVALPFAHAGLYYNFYGRARLPSWVQRCLEWHTGTFGIIIWRVFSADHLNFFIRIYQQRGQNETRTLLSSYDSWRNSRFSHVAESIALATIFTTLKYYPANEELFKERLLRYARTLDKQSDSILVFEYVRIAKVQQKFEYIPIAEYHIDPKTRSLREQILSKVYSVKTIEDGSPIHVGSKPGSYAPPREE